MKNFTMRVTDDFLAKLDLLRKKQPDLPNQSEMLRRLVDAAVHYELLKEHTAQGGLPHPSEPL